MTKQQRVEWLLSTQGKIRGFFKDTYNDCYPSMNQMLNDINKIDDSLVRYGCTISLLGDSIKDDIKQSKLLRELTDEVLKYWLIGDFSDEDLEENRQQFIREVLTDFIEKFDYISRH